MFGFLNIYKPQGKTSHDIVAILRRITKIKQIGHTGTLDPFAEGVLPICIGKSTRLIEYLDDDKAYIGTVKFGSATTTYDIEGEIFKTSDKKITIEDLEQILSHFRGEIEQIPPIYSAIKINGKKLYEYARKGETVEIKPRKVNISKLEIVNFNKENQTAELLIECSKGTYIRSIANDIGEALNCYGHLIKLVRIKAGKFSLKDTKKLKELETIEEIKKNLIYPLEYLNFPKYELNETEKEKVSHGMSIEINAPDGLITLIQNNKLIAICNIENKKAKMLKVFI
jgi:tRNA pseudouridine55 synthase